MPRVDQSIEPGTSPQDLAVETGTHSAKDRTQRIDGDASAASSFDHRDQRLRHARALGYIDLPKAGP